MFFGSDYRRKNPSFSTVNDDLPAVSVWSLLSFSYPRFMLTPHYGNCFVVYEQTDFTKFSAGLNWEQIALDSDR